MQLNFSIKKAWTDLFSNKKYVYELFLLMLFFAIIEIIGKVLKIEKIVIWLPLIFFGGYLTLIANNIIKGSEPVLENIFSFKKNNRNLILVGLKSAVLTVSYLVIIFILGALSILFLNFIKISGNIAFILYFSIIMFLMVFIFILGSLLFSENLRIKDGFNIKRAIASFKLAWGAYILAFFVYFLMAIIRETNIIFICSILVPIFYFFNHAIAQIYKYTLSKMDETKVMKEKEEE